MELYTQDLQGWRALAFVGHPTIRIVPPNKSLFGLCCNGLRSAAFCPFASGPMRSPERRLDDRIRTTTATARLHPMMVLTALQALLELVHREVDELERRAANRSRTKDRDGRAWSHAGQFGGVKGGREVRPKSRCISSTAVIARIS